MASITVNTSIPAPPEAVWADISRLHTHAEWMGDVAGIEFQGSRRVGIGTRMIVATKVGPLRTRDLIEITEWEDAKVMGVAHRGLISGSGIFTLEPDGQGTLFAWTESLRFPWFLGGAITAHIARPVLRRIWRRNLARLRERFVNGP